MLNPGQPPMKLNGTLARSKNSAGHDLTKNITIKITELSINPTVGKIIIGFRPFFSLHGLKNWLIVLTNNKVN
jgi:hypothetical protein